MGCQNLNVSEIADIVADVVCLEGYKRPSIQTQASTDTRSYHVNSEKILQVLGFVPKRSVEDAVRDLCLQFRLGKYQDALTNPEFTNVKQLVDKGYAVHDSLASYRKDRYAVGAV